MLIKGFFAIHVYDFLKKVHLYMSIQDYMAIRDLRVFINMSDTYYLVIKNRHENRKKTVIKNMINFDAFLRLFVKHKP